MERLDKIIANAGFGSRSDVKLLVKAGRIRVNGTVEKDIGRKVSETDEILVDGKAVNTCRFRYFMLNKPAGLVSSTEDEKDGSENVIRLFNNEKIKGLFPVGRLDKDTTGLLIITNDGELGHRLTSPAHHEEKVYEALLNGIPDESAAEAFAKGIEFKDFTSKPAKLEIISTEEAENRSLARVTITEGKFHQVKRMFLKVGCEVIALKRLSMGGLKLDASLQEGMYRELTSDELALIRKMQ